MRSIKNRTTLFAIATFLLLTQLASAQGDTLDWLRDHISDANANLPKNSYITSAELGEALQPRDSLQVSLPSQPVFTVHPVEIRGGAALSIEQIRRRLGLTRSGDSHGSSALSSGSR